MRRPLTEEQRLARNAYQREWERVNSSYIRDQKRFRKYGLTREMLDEYLDAQEGCCGFCGGQLPKDESAWAVDHDHATGEFRSITHIRCNVTIGAAEMHYDGYMAVYHA